MNINDYTTEDLDRIAYSVQASGNKTDLDNLDVAFSRMVDHRHVIRSIIESYEQRMALDDGCEDLLYCVYEDAVGECIKWLNNGKRTAKARKKALSELHVAEREWNGTEIAGQNLTGAEKRYNGLDRRLRFCRMMYGAAIAYYADTVSALQQESDQFDWASAKFEANRTSARTYSDKEIKEYLDQSVFSNSKMGLFYPLDNEQAQPTA